MTAAGGRGEPSLLADDGLPPLRDVIRRDGLAAKKSLGQNFILDLNLTRRIARCCGPLEGRTVVEVGPGPGGLTRALFWEGAAAVVAVERDGRCAPALEEIAGKWPGKLHINFGDALDTDWPRLLGEVGLGDEAHRPIIAANLPYGVATKLLTGWVETEGWPPWYQRMVLMFQKEVAERIVAQPGSKAYGRLSVLVQWRCEAEIVLHLPPQAFVPAPKVSSAVVVVKPRVAPLQVLVKGALGRVTGAVFGQRRKMLRSSLRQICELPEAALEVAGIAPEKRGEDIDVAGFVRLANAIFPG